MKTLKTLFLSISVLFIVSNIAQAKIWRVNNNIGINANFTSAQAAHDAALTLPGDTLMFEGSNASYGNLRLSKRLTVVGPGYFLGSNPETQAFLVDVKFSTVVFAAGSQNSSFQGININGSQVFIGTNNITFSRNYNIGQLFVGYDNTIGGISISNCLISQNFLIKILITSQNPINTGILISNNFIGTLFFESNTSALILNNVLVNGANSIGAFNTLFANNIQINPAATFIAGSSNNTYNNNISANTLFTPGGSNIGSNNQTNVNMTNVFTVPADFAVETSFQLKSPGLGIGTAQNGGDCGIFGGTNPYVLSGMPNVPSVYFYNVPATGSNTNPLNISIKAKSRN